MTFNQTRAAAIRQAIIHTVDAIRGDVVRATPEPLRSELQAHLKGLLEMERSILSAESAAQTADEPWYPDDSGEWVEVPDGLMEMPNELSGDEIVNVLLLREREFKMYSAESDDADNYYWAQHPGQDRRIVAYKKVKS